jgi:hypothetical protein
MLMLEMFSVALPVFESVTLCAVLVVPTFFELNVRLVGERLTAGAGGGPVPPPPPPAPQATQTPTTSKVAGNANLAGRRAAISLISIARASSPARSQGSQTRRRKLGGNLSSGARGTTIVWPVVVTLTVAVTADGPLKVSGVDGGVQVTPVGTFVQLKLTVPVNPPVGVIVTVENPDPADAERVTLVADKKKSETMIELQLFTRFAALTEPSPVARSYPTEVAQAGVELLGGLTSRMP